MISHKNAPNAQNNAMTIALIAVCVEIVLIALLFPIKLTATAHFSLANSSVNVQVKLAKVSIVRINVKLSDGLIVKINGKAVKSQGISPQAIGKLIAFIAQNRIMSANDLIAYVGAKDAKSGAILSAIMQMSSIFEKTIVKDCFDDRFDAECAIDIKINAVQATKAIVISKGR